MWNSYVFGENGVTHLLLGFAIALVVGLTGIGGGSFTVPALLLLVGLPAADAVGTAFVFAGVLRLVAAPFYLLGRQVHGRYFRLLIIGAVPGLVLGIIALRMLAKEGNSSVVIIILGALLAVTAGVTFLPRVHNPRFAGNNSRWLPWLAFPIGVESGFSSAGAGALGTVLLLNYSEMTPTQVVGTDILFGLVLAIIGSVAHWTFGSISASTLLQLLEGGVPGVVMGCLLARKVPAHKLKTVVAMVALFAGLQLVWSGTHSLGAKHAIVQVGLGSQKVSGPLPGVHP
jgi:uncharacterized membrane protein YfcA